MQTHIGTLQIGGEEHLLQSECSYMLGSANETLPNFIQVKIAGVEAKHILIHLPKRDEVIIYNLATVQNTYLKGERLKPISSTPVKGNFDLCLGEQGKVKFVVNSVDVAQLDSSGFHESIIRKSSNISDLFASSPETSHVRNINGISLEANITADSFFIPETQQIETAHKKSDKNEQVSTFLNKSNEDFCIPETQLPAAEVSLNKTDDIFQKPIDFALPSKLLAAECEENINDCSSQFRICTQDFREDYNNDSNDSNDLLLAGDVQYSMVIPKIKHQPIELLNNVTTCSNAGKETELEKINWEKRSLGCSERDDTRTPDIFDFPVLENGQGKNETTEKSTTDAALNNSQKHQVTNIVRPIINIEPENDDDLMPTQVFVPTKPIASNNTALNTNNDEHLNLSGKENFLTPAIPALTTVKSAKIHQKYISELQATQVFIPTINVKNVQDDNNDHLEATQVFPLSKAAKEICDKSQKSVLLKANNKTDQLLEPTQVFPFNKAIKEMNSKSHNSTLLTEANNKNVVSFFEELESTPAKLPQPLSKQGSTLSSDMETDMLLCTPQFIKESFNNSKLVAKQKSLFGDDSDDEQDVLQLINAPKMAKDFDSLFLNSKIEIKECSKQVVAPKKHHFNHFNKGLVPTDQATKKHNSIDEPHHSKSLSRDERHVAREQNKKTVEKDLKSKKEKRKLEPSNEEPAKKVSKKQPEEEKKTKTIESNKKAEKLTKKVGKKESTNKEQNGDANINTEEETATVSRKVSSNRQKRSEESNKKTEEETKKVSRNDSVTKDKKQEESNKHTDEAIKSASRKESASKAKKDESSRISEEEIKRVSRNDISKETKGTTADNEIRKQSKDKLETKPKRVTRMQSQDKNESKSDELNKGNHRNESTKFEQEPKDKTSKKQSKLRQQSKDSNADIPAARVTRLRSQQKEGDTIQEQNPVQITNKKINKRRPTIPLELKNEADLVMPAKRVTRLRSKLSEGETSNIPSISDESSQASNDAKSNTSSNSHQLKRIIRVCTSMVNPEKLQQLEQNSCGLWTLIKNPQECDILIMDSANRTFKFLMAMARGIPIVTSKWLEVMNKTHKMPQGSQHFFSDAAFEKKYKFSLIKSLDMARKHKLLQGYEFVMTSEIVPSPSEMTGLITCSGGIVHAQTPPASSVRKGHAQKLYLISTPEERKNWQKYRHINGKIRIIPTEGIMASVMLQSVKPVETMLLC